jgi:hypothetical protein
MRWIEMKNNSAKTLKLIIRSQIIQQLGIQMYQKPADVIAELIANAWDADAENVSILLTDNCYEIMDNGNGMSFEECQNYFLNVGRDRRSDTGTDKSSMKGRPVLGRKGIGKFAGFGIANIIEIDTISQGNGEHTCFRMDLEKIYEQDKMGKDQKIIEVITYSEPNEDIKKQHGTKVRLILKSNYPIDTGNLSYELGRRFLLTQQYDDFKVDVDGNFIETDISSKLEYFFPRDLTDDELKKFPGMITRDGWAEVPFGENKIYWRIGYFENTIKEEELRGVAIFARGKLAQKPFFFDLSGGISAQNSLEYLTGQVRIDFIDTDDLDLIATERQRINLQFGVGLDIKSWGQELIKITGSIWKARRAEARIKALEDKVGKFKERLDKFPPSERKTVKSVLLKIANFDRLGKKRFEDWCNDILTSWETGKLRGLLEDIANSENIDSTKMLEILQEAQVLTALNIAESIKTKIVTIAELKKRVDAKDLENSIRDYIYENPWLIHPKWESYKKETAVSHIISDRGVAHLDKDGVFSGRVDLALSSGDDLLLIEFMRPGLKLDRNHLSRLNDYVSDIRVMIAHETGLEIKQLSSAYVIADSRSNDIFIADKIIKYAKDSIFMLTWDSLIAQAIKQWEEHLNVLKQNNYTDPRIQAL